MTIYSVQVTLRRLRKTPNTFLWSHIHIHFWGDKATFANNPKQNMTDVEVAMFVVWKNS